METRAPAVGSHIVRSRRDPIGHSIRIEHELSDNDSAQTYEVTSPHKLQGIGAGFIPANLHTDTLDGIIQVSEEDAFGFTVRAARTEGIFVGPSSGASLAAVAQKLPDLPDGTRILTYCYDTGERYLSVEGLFDDEGSAED